jgi:hypothetical protein
MLVHPRGVFLKMSAVATLLGAVSAETAEGADARQLFRRAQEKYQAGQFQDSVTLLEQAAEQSHTVRSGDDVGGTWRDFSFSQTRRVRLPRHLSSEDIHP